MLRLDRLALRGGAGDRRTCLRQRLAARRDGIRGDRIDRAVRAGFVAHRARLLAAIAAGVLVAFGTNPLLDALPALIAAFVAFLFARTLLPKRTPLIARAIVAIDGPEWLAKPHVARYARSLTAMWAIYQTLLAALALCGDVARRVAAGTARVRRSILPVAVAALFIVEFMMRPLWLPDVPRHSLLSFARRLILAWPNLLDDPR